LPKTLNLIIQMGVTLQFPLFLRENNNRGGLDRGENMVMFQMQELTT